MRIVPISTTALRAHSIGARLALAILIALAVGSTAKASNWSMNGSSCVPGDPAIQGNLYTITGGSLTHQTGKTGLITLYCPITGTWGGNKPTVLRMTYMNNRPAIAQITAQVIRLRASDGGLSVVSPVLTGSNATNVGVRIGLSFSHTFDFKNSYYYVRVDINRTSTEGFAKLFGVSLDCLTCPAN